jgi:hypothetical protein
VSWTAGLADFGRVSMVGARPMWSGQRMVDELHVYPSRDGARWLVEGVASSHLTATEAERTARRRATACGARSICLHDCYHRVRAVSVSSSPTQGAADSAARIAASSA